jgi:hypothetical protein
MEFEDFVEPEIAVTAAVAAAVFSPRARKVIRKGLVYGMAGALAAGDVVTSFARSIGRGVQQASSTPAQAMQETDRQIKEEKEKEGEPAKDAESPGTRQKGSTKAERKSA